MISILAAKDTSQRWHQLTIDDSAVPYFYIALACMVLEYLWHTILDVRQFRAVYREPPASAREQYDEAYIASTRAYSLDKKRFGFIKGVFDVVQNVAVLWYMLLPLFWKWAEVTVQSANPKWEGNEYLVSIVFSFGVMLLSTFGDIPWSAWSAFIIEERHGFNKQTVATFVTDILKSLALSSVFTPLLLLPLIYMLKQAGPMMAIYLWLLVFSFQIIGMTIYPTLIAPLFNTYKALPDGSLRDGIEALAASLQFPLKKLFVVDGSRRSAHSNAYMYGFWKNKRIVLYDTLIEQCKENEIVAVLAHELGHWKMGHTIRLLVATQAVILGRFLLFSVFHSSEHLLESFGFKDSKPVLISLLLFMMVSQSLDAIIGWLFNMVSRAFEFQADNFAVKLKHGEPLLKALKVLEKENKSDIVVDPLYSSYHYSHPPMQERIQAIHAALAKVE